MAGSPAAGGDVAGGNIKPGAATAIFLQGSGRAGASCPGAVAVHSTGTHHSIMITPTAPPMAQAGLSGLAPCSVNAGPASVEPQWRGAAWPPAKGRAARRTGAPD